MHARAAAGGVSSGLDARVSLDVASDRNSAHRRVTTAATGESRLRATLVSDLKNLREQIAAERYQLVQTCHTRDRLTATLKAADLKQALRAASEERKAELRQVLVNFFTQHNSPDLPANLMNSAVEEEGHPKDANTSLPEMQQAVSKAVKDLDKLRKVKTEARAQLEFIRGFVQDASESSSALTLADLRKAGPDKPITVLSRFLNNKEIGSQVVASEWSQDDECNMRLYDSLYALDSTEAGSQASKDALRQFQASKGSRSRTQTMADNVVMPWRDHGITSAIMTNGARAEGASAKEQEEASSSLPSAEESDREDEDDDLQSFLEEVTRVTGFLGDLSSKTACLMSETLTAASRPETVEPPPTSYQPSVSLHRMVRRDDFYEL